MRFFSPPENPSLTARLSIDWSMSSSFDFSLHQLHELHRVELGLAVVLALGVERGLEEVGVVHAGDLDRVLERHEDAFAGALVGIHLEQVLPLEEDLAAGDVVLRMPGQRARQRALAGAVGPHDGVHFAGVHVKVDPLEDLLVLGLDLQILDIEHVLIRHSDAFQAHAQQLLRLDRELHRQLAEHFLAEAADDHVDGVLRRDAALAAVEDLVFADLRRGRLVLHRAEVLLISRYGNVCAPHLSPMSSESHCE